MSSEPTNILEDLDTKVWKTKGSRFNACRRLQSRKTWGSYLVSAYSIYILTISIYLLTQPGAGNFFNMLSIVGSLLILVFSLHEGSQNAEQKAERHHLCAKELAALYDKIVIRVKQSNNSDADHLVDEYASIIARSPENHETIDYELFRAEHDMFRIPWWKVQFIKLEHGIFKITCLVLIIIPPAFLIFSQIKH
nr:SLATT domain-containing protein [uncultured Pseudomonas sp.]